MAPDPVGHQPPAASVRSPQQGRSRESFARVRRAVLDILKERADGAFSIAEVSKRSGVSVGAIYGRVAGKADLLRAVQSEEFDLFETDMRDRLEAASRSPGNPAERVLETVRTFATCLRENAPLLTPFIALAQHDEPLRSRGIYSYRRNEKCFVDALGRILEGSRPLIARSELIWTHEVIFSTLARHIDLGGATSEFAEVTYDGEELLDRLCTTASRVLRLHERPGTV